MARRSFEYAATLDKRRPPLAIGHSVGLSGIISIGLPATMLSADDAVILARRSASISGLGRVRHAKVNMVDTRGRPIIIETFSRHYAPPDCRLDAAHT